VPERQVAASENGRVTTAAPEATTAAVAITPVAVRRRLFLRLRLE
jgi:hypothetical protein